MDELEAILRERARIVEWLRRRASHVVEAAAFEALMSAADDLGREETE